MIRMYDSLTIHTLPDIWTATSKAAMVVTCIQVFVCTYIFITLGQIPKCLIAQQYSEYILMYV